MDKIRINLRDLLMCIANAQDLVSAALSNHHQQVAYLAFRLAEQLNLPIEQQKDIFIASIIHDIGALSVKERLELVEAEPVNINSHGFRSAKLLEGFKPLRSCAGIVKYHHIPWSHGEGKSHMGEEVPLSSHIIHLADRACAAIRPGSHVITQLPGILANIQGKKGEKFHPDIVDALFDLGKKEYVWLDLVSQFPARMLRNADLFSVLSLEMDDLIDLGIVFSRIIDFRSRFTSRHSAGVAKTAERLAELTGFSGNECKMMLIAGYLHDLGKIAISEKLLEKQSRLSKDEYNEMRSHTYYTYQFLEPIPQLRTINAWASLHHERLDGTGYPFQLSGDSIPLGARIMAVADIFTAITEDRPYRKGMDEAGAKEVLKAMVRRNAIDGRVVDLLVENFGEINKIREAAQIQAAEDYKSFLQA